MKEQMILTDGGKRMLRMAMCGMLTCFFMMLFSLNVFAANGVVKTSNVNIRAKAGTDSESVGAANLNDKVTILAEETGSDGKVWYKVKTANDITGYIRSDFVTKESEGEADTTQVTAVDAKKGYVKGSNGVNIRKSASTSSAKVATAQGGSEVTIVGEANGSDGKLWYQIQFEGNGTQMNGYIRSDLIDFNPPQQDAETTEISGEGSSETTPETSEEPEVPSEEVPVEPTPETDTTSAADLVLVEPESTLENIPEGFTQTAIKFGDDEITAWAKGDFYIVYASKNGEAPQWYLFDGAIKGYVKYSGLMPAQQTAPVEEKAPLFNWLTIVLLALVLILAAVVVVLLLKVFKNQDYDYDDYDEDDDDEDDEEDVAVTKHEMNYVNQRPMENKTIEPKTLIMPDPGLTYTSDMDEDEDDEYDEDDEDEVVTSRPKKKGFGKKLLDYFTTEVDEDEDEDDGDDDDDDDDDDDLNFIDL